MHLTIVLLQCNKTWTPLLLGGKRATRFGKSPDLSMTGAWHKVRPFGQCFSLVWPCNAAKKWAVILWKMEKLELVAWLVYLPYLPFWVVNINLGLRLVLDRLGFRIHLKYRSTSPVVSPGKLIKCGEILQKKASYIHDSYLYLTLKHNKYSSQCYRGEKEVAEYQKGLV